MIIPPGKLNKCGYGPYYKGDFNAPKIDYDAMLRNAEASAGFAREQSELAHAQALEMEATRNAYASAIAEREQQNEAQLEAQQQAMETMLSDVQAGIAEEEDEGITAPNFFLSLMDAMQAGTGNQFPNAGMAQDNNNAVGIDGREPTRPYSGIRPA